jgi:hypothetical protein
LETLRLAWECGRVIGSPQKLWIYFLGSPRDFSA